MTDLAKGQNARLDGLGQQLLATLRWPAGGLDADLCALLCDSTLRVGSDADLVFYNQPSSPNCAVVHVGKSTSAPGQVSDAVSVDLAALPAQVTSVVLCASVDAGCLGQLGPVSIEITGDGADCLRYVVGPASVETALLVAELYLRHGTWKLRAIGQGYADGLAGLVRDFGVQVDDEPPLASAAGPAVDWANPPLPPGYET